MWAYQTEPPSKVVPVLGHVAGLSSWTPPCEGPKAFEGDGHLQIMVVGEPVDRGRQCNATVKVAN